MHDATVGFQPSPANWRAGAGAPGGGEVICHNDVAPGHPAFQRHLAEGHVQLYRRDLAFIQAQQQRLERAC